MRVQRRANRALGDAKVSSYLHPDRRELGDEDVLLEGQLVIIYLVGEEGLPGLGLQITVVDLPLVQDDKSFENLCLR